MFSIGIPVMPYQLKAGMVSLTSDYSRKARLTLIPPAWPVLMDTDKAHPVGKQQVLLPSFLWDDRPLATIQ